MEFLRLGFDDGESFAIVLFDVQVLMGWLVGKLAAYFFPVVFSIPLFGNYLATEWLWSFTPSLSYVGQGIHHGDFRPITVPNISQPGIIMGFPTTLSMNLVCPSHCR